MANFGKSLGWLFGVAAVVLAVVVLVAFSQAGNPALTFREMPKAGIEVATSLFVVTLFIERSMAAFNALIFGEKEREAMLLLLADDARGAGRLAEVLEWKERLRLLLSFAAGLFVATAGVRTLAALFDLTKTTNASPLLFGVDVILTAGLIAGGSNGLAFLIQALKGVIKPSDKPAAAALATHLVTTG